MKASVISIAARSSFDLVLDSQVLREESDQDMKATVGFNIFSLDISAPPCKVGGDDDLLLFDVLDVLLLALVVHRVQRYLRGTHWTQVVVDVVAVLNGFAYYQHSPFLVQLVLDIPLDLRDPFVRIFCYFERILNQLLLNWVRDYNDVRMVRFAEDLLASLWAECPCDSEYGIVELEVLDVGDEVGCQVLRSDFEEVFELQELMQAVSPMRWVLDLTCIIIIHRTDSIIFNNIVNVFLVLVGKKGTFDPTRKLLLNKFFHTNGDNKILFNSFIFNLH